MKNLFFFLFFLITSLMATAQSNDSVYYFNSSEKSTSPANKAMVAALIYKDAQGLYQRKSYYIFNNVLATVSTSHDFKDSIREGKYTHFYPNGILEEKGFFVNGKKHGEFVSLFENGMMRDSANYINGVQVGGYFRWYLSGNPKVVATFDTIGNGSGTYVQFFDNGNVSFKGRLERGLRKVGPWTYYHMNGNKASILSYPALDESVLNSPVVLKMDTLEEFRYDSAESYVGVKCYDTLGVEQSSCAFINRQAIYNRGVDDWLDYLSSSLGAFYSNYRHTGSPVFYTNRFTIDVNSKVIDFSTSTTFHKELDPFVKKLMLKANKWKPAMHNNRVIPQEHRQQIVFVDTLD